MDNTGHPTQAFNFANSPTPSSQNDMLERILAQLKNSDNKLSAFIAHQQQTNDVINSKLNSLQQLSENVKQHNERLISLEAINAQLVSEVNSLKTQMSKHHTVNTSEIIISGIPVNPSITPADITERVFDALGISHLKNHILTSRTVAKKNNPFAAQSPASTLPQSQSNLQIHPTTTSIIATLTSTAVRDLVLSKKRSKRDLKQSDVLGNQSSRNIYVNELLSSEMYNLLRQTKSKAAETAYKFVWSKNGAIFVRKDSGHPQITILSVQDLDKLV